MLKNYIAAKLRWYLVVRPRLATTLRDARLEVIKNNINILTSFGNSDIILIYEYIFIYNKEK